RRRPGASLNQMVPWLGCGEAAGNSGCAADAHTFLGEEVLQFSSLEHLTDDVATANELALDVKLRDSWPARVILDALAQLVGREHVDAVVVHAQIVQNLDDLTGEAALRKARGAFHEKHDVIGLDFV